LVELIDNAELRIGKRKRSREWVTKYHSYESVFNRMMELYKKNKIIVGD